MQEGMLFHDLYEQERSPGRLIPYLLELTFRIAGPLDRERFEASWNHLVARHQALRTVFNHSAAERPIQVVLRERRIAVDFHDLTGLPPDEQQRFIAGYRQRQRETPFDLGRDLLMRIGLLRLDAGLHQMVWMFHHILMDGWCLNILQRELFAIYRALGEGREPELPPAPLYSAYIKYLQGGAARPAAELWRRYLSGYEQPVSPPGWRRLPATAPTELLRHGFELGGEESAALRAVAAAQQVTLNNLFQAAWALLLSRYNGVRDVAFGIVMAGRPHAVPGITDMVGLCTNTVPLRLDVDPGMTLAQLAAAARESFLAVEEHQYSPLADIQGQSLPKRELINHLLVFESYPSDLRFDDGRVTVGGLTLDGFDAYMPNNYDFQLAVFPEERIRVVLSYRRNAFALRQVELMAGHLRQVLAALIADASRPLAAVDVLTPEERRELLAPVPDVADVDEESLEAKVRRRLAQPEQPVALTADGIDVTYEELSRRAGALAAHLAASRGVARGQRVALLLPAGADLITGLLAAVLTGAAFVPLDPADPAARIRLILDDCRPALVLTLRSLAPLCAELGLPALALDEAPWEEWLAGPQPKLTERPETERPPVCYVLYTSGTTGRPKGVEVGEASLLNYAGWLRRRFGLGPQDRTALLSSHAFDLGYTALFGALLHGGRLHLVSEGTRRDPEAVVACVVEHGLTFLKLTPALLHLLVHAGNSARLAEATALRLVLVGGESYVAADLAAFRRLVPWARLRNHYGPTECTIGCLSHELDPAEDDVAAGRQVLGRPIDGVQAYLLDARQEPVPVGVAGELYIAGRCLARGYTAGHAADGARFLAAPWDASLRLYRTGDRAERRADGAFLFLGRADDQLKVRGYRVEPGEVEAALRQTPPVRDAAVLVLKDAAGRPDLAAFVICDGAELDVAALRSRLANLVPSYMIPSDFVPVFRFPLTANGKIDRRALTEHRPGTRRAAGGEVAGATEEALREIWQGVLAVENVGPDDDFFSLGGHSVKAILVLSRVKKKLGARLTVRDLFDHPTVRQLARHIEAGRSGMERRRAVRLRQGSAGAPAVFFLPSVVGTSTLYQEAVAALDADLDAWGLQCRGFDGDEPFAASVAEMADLFAAEVRRLQPRGPYLLCGYSMGVVMALEVAARLEAAGEEASLVLIDGAVEGADGAADAEETDLRQSRYFQRVLALMAENLEAKDLERIGRLAEHNVRLLREHRSRPALRADLFCIEAERAGTPGMMALRERTAGRFVHRLTPGDHFSLFQPPHSRRLLENLAEALATVSPEMAGTRRT